MRWGFEFLHRFFQGFDFHGILLNHLLRLEERVAEIENLFLKPGVIGRFLKNLVDQLHDVGLVSH